MTATAARPDALAGAPSAGAAGGTVRMGFWRSLRPSGRELAGAVAGGLAFAAAFPPIPGVLLIFVCLVPIAVGVARAADSDAPARVAARLGVWFTVVGFGLALYWIAVALSLFTPLAFLAYIGTIIGMSALVALTTTSLFVTRRLTKWPLAILLPAAWVSLEILLAYFSDLAFPWFPLGLAMARHPAWAQAADLSGVHGLSVWIAATNGLLADAWLAAKPSAGAAPAGGGWREAIRRRGVIMPLAVILLLAVAVRGYGAWRLHTTVLRPLARIGIVQPNISEDEKMQRAMQGRFIVPLAAMTRQEEARDHPVLMLWPETALPDFLTHRPDWTDSLRSLARDASTPILFGMLDYTIFGPGPNDWDYFNAAALVDSAGRLGTQPSYHKKYLVPIVERVPFLNPRWFSGVQYFGGFGRGTSARPFDLPFGKVGVLICYESIFPQQARAYRRNGADVIVNLTNDAWFGQGTAPYQHESHLRLRAIETRVGIVRAANTGISEYIDPLGRSFGALPLFVAGTAAYDAQTTTLRSPYVIIGDWAAIACVITTLVLVGVAFGRRRAAVRT